VSIVARTHDEEGALAQASGASAGSEIEESRPHHVLASWRALAAAVAVAIPGVGPIVADGPLAAALGEAAGHAAGDISRALEHARLEAGRSGRWEKRIEGGRVPRRAHVDRPPIETALTSYCVTAGRQSP